MASKTVTTIVFAAVALAGCGSSEGPATPPRPTIPLNVADKLAAESDKVASALRAGDSCRAAAEAEQLQRDTIAAINGGRVPTVFQEQLSGTVNDLASRIVCTPVEEDEEKDEGKDHGKGKGKGKRKGKGKGDD